MSVGGRVDRLDMTRTTMIDLASRWTALWNGNLALADEILAPDFRIEFGAVVAFALVFVLPKKAPAGHGGPPPAE